MKIDKIEKNYCTMANNNNFSEKSKKNKGHHKPFSYDWRQVQFTVATALNR